MSRLMLTTILSTLAAICLACSLKVSFPLNHSPKYFRDNMWTVPFQSSWLVGSVRLTQCNGSKSQGGRLPSTRSWEYHPPSWPPGYCRHSRWCLPLVDFFLQDVIVGDIPKQGSKDWPLQDITHHLFPYNALFPQFFRNSTKMTLKSSHNFSEITSFFTNIPKLNIYLHMNPHAVDITLLTLYEKYA